MEKVSRFCEEGFPCEHGRYLDVPTEKALLGNVVFGIGAVLLLAAATRVVNLRRKTLGAELHSRAVPAP